MTRRNTFQSIAWAGGVDRDPVAEARMQGEELRTIRQELGLSLRELAAALGYAASAVRRLRQWEREDCGEGVGRKVRALLAARRLPALPD